MTNTTILGGTTWKVSSPTNGDGTFTFSMDNTGVYAFDNSSTSFYWWQKGNSFWMQKKNSTTGWLEIFEGSLTTNSAGSGKIIAAEQVNGSIYIEEFTMTIK